MGNQELLSESALLSTESVRLGLLTLQVISMATVQCCPGPVQLLQDLLALALQLGHAVCIHCKDLTQDLLQILHGVHTEIRYRAAVAVCSSGLYRGLINGSMDTPTHPHLQRMSLAPT